MNELATFNQMPVLDYARRVRALHALALQGQHHSDEADAIRDEMDAPWDAMTEQEQDRMRGLSEDLYALAEGGPPCVAMSEQQIQAWKKDLEECKNRYLQGDIDSWLAFWRKPRPNSFPPLHGIPLSVIHFFQAQSWEKLGNYDIAATFMMAAEKYDPELSGMVLHTFNLAGNRFEARKYANRILDNPKETPEDIFMAGSTLLADANWGTRIQLKPLCSRLIPVLTSALEKQRRIPRAKRELPETEEYLIGLVGMCYELVGKDRDALSLYEGALKTYPRNPDLFLRRGIVRVYFQNDPNGFSDIEMAASLGSKRCLPFLLLAEREFNVGKYWEAKSLAQKASEKNGTNKLLSLAYQVIAMSLSMLNQNVDWVLDNFKLAEKCDPGNPTIVQNRAIAIARADKKETSEPWKLDKPEIFDFVMPQPDRFDDRVNRQMERMLSVA